MSNLSLFLVVLALPAILTGLICYFSKEVGARLGLTDTPDGVRRLHAAPTPLVGGLAVLIPTFLVSAGLLLAAPLPSFVGPAIIASGFILVLGVFDDRSELSAVIRLASFILATSFALFLDGSFVLESLSMNVFGYRFTIPLGPASSLVTLLIVVGFVNASNMADGMNGQFLGSTVIWSLFLALYMTAFVGAAAALPFVALAVSSGVALFFNLRGALFTGSAGSYGASLFVALSAIAVYRLADGSVPAGVPFFWFYLPVVDCLRLFVVRVAQGRSPFSPDRNHIHHALMERMSPARALGVYLFLLAAPGVAAIFDHQLGWTGFVLCLGAYAAIFALRGARQTSSVPSTPTPADRF